ncbi:MAG: putative ABC transporter permease [Ruthenibacterium lactatiformans]
MVIETIFCWIASGRLSQRTGLVWGPFNLIYGIGAVLLTVCLHPFIGKSDRWIFIGGSIIGGAFEYFCSWLQETVLGTVSWDYTGYPFNLNGRINLLYCLFWGALALVWVKEVFPRLNGFIERRVSKTYGVVISWVLIAFMLANSLVSGAAVLRQSQRYEGVPATHAWQQVLDDRFPDSRLAKIYPSMVRGKNKRHDCRTLKSQERRAFAKHGVFSLSKKRAFSTSCYKQGLRPVRRARRGVILNEKGFTTPFSSFFPRRFFHFLAFFVRLRAPCFRKSTALFFLYSILANQARRASPPHRVRDRANTTAAMVRYRFLFMTT